MFMAVNINAINSYCQCLGKTVVFSLWILLRNGQQFYIKQSFQVSFIRSHTDKASVVWSRSSGGQKVTFLHGQVEEVWHILVIQKSRGRRGRCKHCSAFTHKPREVKNLNEVKCMLLHWINSPLWHVTTTHPKFLCLQMQKSTLLSCEYAYLPRVELFIFYLTFMQKGGAGSSSLCNWAVSSSP